MSDTMRRRSCALSAVCMVACMLSNVPDADACNVGSSTTLVWPTHDGLDESARRLAPTDTQIWLNVGAPWGVPDEVLLEDAEGNLVDVMSGTLRSSRKIGVDDLFLVLIPNEELSPSSTYNVVIVPEDEHLRIEDAQYEGVEYVREGWTFTTGAGPYEGPSIPEIESDYVALEREDVYDSFCQDHERDTLHVLRVFEFESDLPLLHTFRVTYPDRSTYITRRIWSRGPMDGGEVRIELGESLGQDGYPCVTHTVGDVVGRTLRHEVGCEPSLCVEPPPVGSEGDEATNQVYGQFFNASFDVWTQREVACGSFRLDEPDEEPVIESLDSSDEELGGCATIPASPIPRTPLALGALALLGLLRTNQTRKRHV